MRLLRGMMVAGVVLFGASAVRADVQAPPARHRHLSNGARSIDTLVDRLLHALAANDEHALHRLRVTEDEYRQIIIPGTVKVGEAPRAVAAEPSAFFWSMLNQKSEDVGRQILKTFGRHTYKRKELTYTKGTRQFAWYTAHGNVQLQLEDEQGQTHELRVGTIAEISGQYKFIGFNAND